MHGPRPRIGLFAEFDQNIAQIVALARQAKRKGLAARTGPQAHCGQKQPFCDRVDLDHAATGVKGDPAKVQPLHGIMGDVGADLGAFQFRQGLHGCAQMRGDLG